MAAALKELQTQFDTLGAKVNVLLAKGGKISDDEFKQVEGWQAEMEGLQTAIVSAKKRESAIKAAQEKAKGLSGFSEEPEPPAESLPVTEARSNKHWSDVRKLSKRIGVPWQFLEVGEQEADRTKSFSDFLQHVTAAGAYKNEESKTRLERVYKSGFNKWSDEAVKEQNKFTAQRDQKTLFGASGTAGGYVVPKEYYTQLMMVAAEDAIVRPRATVIPMTANAIEIPLLNQYAQPASGSTYFFGGLIGTWTKDTDDKPETEPKFVQDEMRTHEIAGYTELARNLIQTSFISVESLLTMMIGKAVAWFEDYAFLRGNGIGKPVGVLNSPAMLTTGSARGSATAITQANVSDVYVSLMASSMNKAVFLASQPALKAILNMTGAANQVFIPNGFVASSGGAIQGGLNKMIFGNDLVISEKMPALNSLGDFCAIDFSYYLIGDQGSLEIASSEHYKFRANNIAYRFVHRVGGMPWVQAPIYLSDGTTQVSPFVQLQVQ